ncbi:MAG: hypothetical protein O2823_04000 [Actinomycetota bacterium]|nr:hypothetical protein [Actinomycetota bacterium]
MNSTAITALIWWVIPFGAVLGAIIYGIWITKYKKKFDNETNRSVNSFKKFQSSFKFKK